MLYNYQYNQKREPMRLGVTWFDATMERNRSYNADVPVYPVESGFKVSDAVLFNPLEITLKAIITEMPLTHNMYGRSIERTLYNLTRQFYEAEPLTLHTNSGKYENMIIQSISIPETTEMVNAVEVSITLKQVRITGSTEAYIEDYDPATKVITGVRAHTEMTDAEIAYANRWKEQDDKMVALGVITAGAVISGVGIALSPQDLVIKHVAEKAYFAGELKGTSTGGYLDLHTDYLLHNAW